MKLIKYSLTVIFVFIGVLLFGVIVSSADGVAISVTSSDGTPCGDITDNNYNSTRTYDAGTTLTVSSNAAFKSLYIRWDKEPGEWQLTVGNDNLTFGTQGFIHEYVELPVGANTAVINVPSGGAKIADIFAFSDSETPDFVQKWDDPYDKADILLYSTHADDECLFFGGIIPTYVAQGYRVQVAYHCDFYRTEPHRRHELLDGLWTMGVTHYPQLGEFKDQYSESLSEAKSQINYDDVIEYVVRTIRRFKPLVLVGQDLKGEYGHGQHMLTATAITEAITLTADNTKYTASAEKYGVWDVPKTYLHLYNQNTIELNARNPLPYFGGRTALQVAHDAYQCHKSQLWCWFYVSDGYNDSGDPTGYKYSCTKYGLYRSLVGSDTTNDLLENVMPYDEQEGQYIEIYDYEDFKTMEENPSGSFRLMRDIDLGGRSWQPIRFSGIFDGNGHAVMNFKIDSVHSDSRTTIDGNSKQYETYFAGFFSILENATVKNLSLLGVTADINYVGNAFVGALAGYASNAYITNCDVYCILKLSVDGKNSGIGGVVGFGNAIVEGCNVDSTLVFVDGSEEYFDEQFLGGIMANGRVSIKNCDVKIDGYISEHGYVHSGGLVGMFMLYDYRPYKSFITGNKISGQIKFFEHTPSRRAYCKDTIGEVIDWHILYEGNASDFKVNEVKKYDTVILPHTCGESSLKTETVAHDCESYGYDLVTCSDCGYSYKTNFKPKIHDVSFYETYKTFTWIDGKFYVVGKGICSKCGEEVYKKSAVNVTPDPTPTSPVETPAPETDVGKPTEAPTDNDIDKTIRNISTIILVVFAVIVAGLFAIIYFGKKKR